jgi:hypothetical protein
LSNPPASVLDSIRTRDSGQTLRSVAALLLLNPAGFDISCQ